MNLSARPCSSRKELNALTLKRSISRLLLKSWEKYSDLGKGSHPLSKFLEYRLRLFRAKQQQLREA
jgi:hypothetical protein